MESKTPFIVLYDGHCPLCLREVNFLSRRSNRAELQFEDIQANGFQPAQYGRNKEELMARIHGVRADGSLVTGVEAFREAYKRAGIGWILAPTAWPGLRLLADFGYSLFARNRLRVGRLFGRNGGVRCDGECSCGGDGDADP